jgi:tetratricopeptide (TPR) repeat protein
MKSLLTVAAILLAVVVHSPASYGAESPTQYKTYKEQDRELFALLKSKKYDELDAYLTTLLKRYETEPQLEPWADLALDTFNRADSGLETLFDEWVARRPKSFAAYLARGTHYDSVGWALRGARNAAHTSQEQFAGMAQYFEKALKDFDRAYELNDRSQQALCYKMGILMNSSARDEIRALRDRVLQLNPLSSTVRWIYIGTLLPRWGGSIEAVEKEIEAARPYYEKNPKLKALEGRLAAEAGDQAMYSGRAYQAVEYYTAALMHGRVSNYLYGRGEAFARQNNFPAALKDLMEMQELRPNRQRAFYLRGFVYYATEQDQQAIAELTEAITRNPFDHKSWQVRGGTYLAMGKPDLALADLEKALSLEPDNKEYAGYVQQAKAMLGSRR